jgi:hypothetical protein
MTACMGIAAYGLPGTNGWIMAETKKWLTVKA